MRLLCLWVFLVAVGILQSSASDSTAKTRTSIPEQISPQATEFVRKYTLFTGTDRGGELMAFSSSRGAVLKIIATIGLSKSDLIREFSFDENRLIEVQETRRTYSYNEKNGKIDFTKIASTTTANYNVARRGLSVELTSQEEATPKSIPKTFMEQSNFFLKFLKEHRNTPELNIERQLKQDAWR